VTALDTAVVADAHVGIDQVSYIVQQSAQN
jgi:hypothetical protein